jgi:hypothetical protein
VRYLTIAIPVAAWHHVDGSIDNSMAIDVVEGLIISTINGSCVRDAGWRAAAMSGVELDPHGWPPGDHPLQITLREEHWEWVIGELDRWRPYDDGELHDLARTLITAAIDSYAS